MTARSRTPCTLYRMGVTVARTGARARTPAGRSPLRRRRSVSATGKRCQVPLAQVRSLEYCTSRCGEGAEGAGSTQSATRVAPARHRSTQFSVRNSLMTCGAPLRNRTVDLLLTINSNGVASLQVRRLTSQNASPDQHQHACGKQSRAQFATRSATQADLQRGGRPPS